MSVTEALDSIVVLDANEEPTPSFREQVCAWLNRHGVDPMVTYRVEVLLLDAPFARVYQYEPDAEHIIKVNEDGTDALYRDPFDVLLSELPPEATPCASGSASSAG